METVSVRDLRNDGGSILRRVQRGEVLIVTMDGKPIAELRPVARKGYSARALMEEWKRLPPMDPVKLRQDIDSIMDTSL